MLMKKLKTLLGWLRQRAENISALLLASMFLTFLLQIIFRYLLNLPIGWTVEWVTLAWLWGILFGYAFIVRDVDIIRMDLVYTGLPLKVRHVLDVIAHSIVIGILAYSFLPTIDYITFMAIERTAFMRIPYNWVFAIYVPFIITVMLQSLITIYHAIVRFGQPALEEPSHD